MMFRNYLIIAVRNLLRHKLYTLINILGLGIGIGCVILVGLYVQNELSYDTQHKDRDRLYRVMRELRAGDGHKTYEWRVSGAVGPALESDFPEIQTTVRTMPRSVWVKYENKILNEVFCLVDPNFLDVFTYPMARGDKSTLLQPQSVFLTESAAQRFFGNTDPIGKTISVEGAYLAGDYMVAGILKDLPRNLTLRFDILSAAAPNQFSLWTSWLSRNIVRVVTVYALLKENASPESIQSKLPAFMERYNEAEVASRTALHLQPLKDVYLHSRRDYGLAREEYGNITDIYAASLVALFILFIACINFTNLTTARSANRAREVGMRKVVGAHRTQLAVQFLGESLLLAILSLIVSLGTVELILPLFNTYTGNNLVLNFTGGMLPALMGLTLLVGFVAGGYPALFLSRFRPVEVLKGSLSAGASGSFLRKILVVFQFVSSVILIIVTIIVFQQMRYIQKKDLGFDKDHIIEMRLFWEYRYAPKETHGLLRERYNVVKDAFLQHPNIMAATISRFPHGRSAPQAVFGAFQGGDDEWRMRYNEVDEDFIDVFKIPLIVGRNFSKDAAVNFTKRNNHSQDEYILNEAAVKALGWTDPIGKPFSVKGRRPGRVIGVVKNFHTRTLYEPIEPTVLYASNVVPKTLYLKIGPGDFEDTIGFIKKTWAYFLPTRPFAYAFTDDILNQRYAAEQQLGRAMGVFSGLAIFVACLGLLGLVSFLAQQRKKEVGIRKVLGASAINVALLFFKESTWLVLIACLLAWPIAYLTIREWLQNFAYHIPMTPFPFLISGLCMVALTMMTMAYQVIKAVCMNPVDSLRQE